MDCSVPGFSVHYRLPELAQTHVHWVGDAMAVHPELLAIHQLHFRFPCLARVGLQLVGFCSVFACLSLHLGACHFAALTSVTSLSQVPGPLWPSVTCCDLTSLTHLRRAARFSACSAFYLLLARTSNSPKDHELGYRWSYPPLEDVLHSPCGAPAPRLLTFS